MGPLAPTAARELALEVARDAAGLLRQGWGHAVDIRAKRLATDLVTEWDTRSEALIRARLHDRAPGIPILGEELGRIEGDRDAGRWLVDPIDGTVNFAHGVPFFTVSIGYEHAGQVMAGVVLAPIFGWEFAAARGAGATLGGVPLRVSTTDTLGASLLTTGFPYDRQISAENNFAAFIQLQRVAGAVRRFGAASLDLCMVARGWVDGYWELKLKPWDMAAGSLIVHEAGGRLSALDGSPFDLESGQVVASNGVIHEALIAELGRART